MPDISMCKNEECPLREKCYRFLAEPDPYWQTYADFKYEIKDGEVHCDYFWDNKEYKQTKH